MIALKMAPITATNKITFRIKKGIKNAAVPKRRPAIIGFKIDLVIVLVLMFVLATDPQINTNKSA